MKTIEIGPVVIPFSIEEFNKLQKEGSNFVVKTEEGVGVRVLCVDAKNEYPVITLIKTETSDKETICTYTKDGYEYEGGLCKGKLEIHALRRVDIESKLREFYSISENKSRAKDSFYYTTFIVLLTLFEISQDIDDFHEKYKQLKGSESFPKVEVSNFLDWIKKP